MDIKEELMAVTTELIKESNGDPKQITIREIAKRAGTGVGLINYHFQSKENLIELCVQKIINSVIDNSKPDLQGLSLIERLKVSARIPINFIMDNPEISRISILSDLSSGQSDDNTFRTLEKYLYHISRLNLNEDDYFRAAIMLHGLQGIFLRRKLYRDKFDFQNKQERDRLIDSLIDKLFGIKGDQT